jgi:hypothetical protein
MIEIKTYHGGKIVEPGVYAGVPMASYHGDLCAGPSVSSSGLRQIDQESPAHYFDGSYLNPDRAPEEEKAFFSFGRAVHTLVMRESGFAESFVVRPEKWADWRKAEAREWRSAAVSEGLGVLTPDDLETIRGIARSLHLDPFIREGGFDGLAEHSIVWQDPETGVWMKARPDVMNIEARVLSDLKTISLADGQSCRKAIADHGYHIQLALACEGLEILTGEKFDDGCFLVFAEKKRPYCVNVKPISPNAIWTGRQIVRRAVRKFAECVENGAWPGYEDNGRVAHLPAWLEKRLEEDHAAGLLPDPLHIEPKKEAAE